MQDCRSQDKAGLVARPVLGLCPGRFLSLPFAGGVFCQHDAAFKLLFCTQQSADMFIPISVLCHVWQCGRRYSGPSCLEPLDDREGELEDPLNKKEARPGVITRV